MPTRARAATVSRATSSPSAANASVAAASSLSRLRCASARNGGPVTVMSGTPSFLHKRRFLRLYYCPKRRKLRLSVTPASPKRPYAAAALRRKGKDTPHMSEKKVWFLNSAGRGIDLDVASDEPSHIHIARPSRLLRQDNYADVHPTLASA